MDARGLVLINPKIDHNVAKVVRLAACYGVKHVMWTGRRVKSYMSTGVLSTNSPGQFERRGFIRGAGPVGTTD